jgi:hypothetical protein
MKVRNIRKRDIEKIVELLNEYDKKDLQDNKGLDIFQNYHYSMENISSYYEYDKKGCFIAKEKRSIIGVIFSHSYGKLGCIGPIMVFTKERKNEIKRELMNKAIEYLDSKQNVTTCGLETKINDFSSIKLYSQLDFRPAFQTFQLARKINTNSKDEVQFHKHLEKQNLEIDYFSTIVNKEDVFLRCAWLASKYINALDFRPLIELTNKGNLGDTLLIKRDGFIIGFAICHRDILFKNQEEKALEIIVIVIDRDLDDKTLLNSFLLFCEYYARKNNQEQILLNINSSYWLVFQHLINQDYKIQYSTLRMTKYRDEIKAYDRSNEWLVYCHKWSQ